MTKHLKHTSNGMYGKCIIALMPKIDLEQPPTSEVGGLITKHTQYRTQDNNNEYVGQIWILWRSTDYLNIVGWRYNC